MIMIKAIIRPEKVGIVLQELSAAGFPSVTKLDVTGRGKQRGIKVNNIIYDELPKVMLMLVVNNNMEKDDVIKLIARCSITGEKGAYGDGKIFVSPISEVYTISSGSTEL